MAEVKDKEEVAGDAAEKIAWDQVVKDLECHIMNTGIPCFTVLLLYCASQTTVFSYKLKVCGNPEWSNPMGAIFPTAFAHFRALCHILVILLIFQAFSSLLYLLWWAVISDIIIAKRLQLVEGSDDG